jgi:hypothetical protein
MTVKELKAILAELPDDAVVRIPQYDDLRGITYYDPLMTPVEQRKARYYTGRGGHKVYFSPWSNIKNIKSEGEEDIYVLETF